MNTDFNAFNVRKESIEQQYIQAIDEISKISGKKGAYICAGSSLYEEVAQMLAEKGCDVKVTLKADDTKSTNYVFWGNSQEGRKGSINYIDETKGKLHVFVERCPLSREQFSEFMKDAKSAFNFSKDVPTTDDQTDSAAPKEEGHDPDITDDMADIAGGFDFEHIFDSLFSSHIRKRNSHDEFLRNIENVLSRSKAAGSPQHEDEPQAAAKQEQKVEPEAASEIESNVEEKNEVKTDSKELPVVMIKRRKK